MASVAQTYND